MVLTWFGTPKNGRQPHLSQRQIKKADLRCLRPAFFNLIPAATYVPTQLPAWYNHRKLDEVLHCKFLVVSETKTREKLRKSFLAKLRSAAYKQRRRRQQIGWHYKLDSNRANCRSKACFCSSLKDGLRKFYD